jgi:hypothetical protein
MSNPSPAVTLAASNGYATRLQSLNRVSSKITIFC